MLRTITLIEVCAIAVALLPTNAFPPLPLEAMTRDVCEHIRLTPIFVVGWSLLTSGALVRKACYREMGKHFTFEITIQKDHRLVKSGPYAIVRHPSYSALCMVATGSILCFFGAGSWLKECGALGSILGQAFALVWIVDILFVPSVMLFSRVKIEDEMLESTFGREWKEWAKRTPYAVIPGIY